MPLAVIPVTIPAGQSLSPAVDVGVGDLLRLYMPPDWTPGNVTFQMSPDNVAFFDVFNQSNSAEFMIGIVPGACFITDVHWRALAWMKLRSGTRAMPVVQTVDRTFRLVVLR